MIANICDKNFLLMKTFMYSKTVNVYKNVPQNYFGEISTSLWDISTQNKLKHIFSNRVRLELIIYVHAFKIKSFYAIKNLPPFIGTFLIEFLLAICCCMN